MPDEKSGNCARLKRILQKIADLEGRFAVSGILGAYFERRFIATVFPRGGPDIAD